MQKGNIIFIIQEARTEIQYRVIVGTQEVRPFCSWPVTSVLSRSYFPNVESRGTTLNTTLLCVHGYVLVHCGAEKRNQFPFVRMFFNNWQKLANFSHTVYIRPNESRSISYNYVYLILACVENFAFIHSYSFNNSCQTAGVNENKTM